MDYVAGPEHTLLPDYVPGPEYPEYVSPSDDEIPVEDQPLPANASPTALSTCYVVDFDPSKEDPEEDLEEDPADYPIDGGDDDEEEESSKDDEEEEEEEASEEDEDEEEENEALADSAALPIIDPTRLRRARKTVRLQSPMAASTKALIAEFASAPIPPSPPPSPLSPWSSPLPHIPSPPLPVLSPPLPLPSPPTHTSLIYANAPLGYKATMIWSDIPETDMLFQKRLCLTTPASRFEVGESSTAAAARQTTHTLAHRVDYGFVDIVDASIRASESRVMTVVEEVNERVTDLAITQRKYFRSMASSYEREAVIARQAWSHSEDRSTTLEATIRAQKARDLVTTAFGRIHALEARDRARTRDAGHQDGPADAEHEANKNSRNGDDNHDSGSGGRKHVPTTRECTYNDFLKCQPLNFNGTEGVVGLTQWFEKMEFVFHISNCTVACQIKFATCTLLGSALTWWNSHLKTVGHDAAYKIRQKTLKKMMTTKYCPRSEIKKLETKIWNLKVKGTYVVSYTQRFQELALMCGRMFPEESDEVKKYVGGLLDMIQVSVITSKPKTMQDAIEFATELMDQKIYTFADRQAESKRKLDDNSRNNQTQQQLYKRQNVVRAYTAGPGATTARKLAIWPVTVEVQLLLLAIREPPGQFRGLSLALSVEFRGITRRIALRKNPDSNVVTGTFIVNNRYASILFDTGANRSFVSIAFSSLIDIVPTTLDHDYDVELADRKIIRVNTIIRGCTLNFLNHSFNIDLMPVERGSFDVIIGMDCNNGHESRLNIISCTKTQKYLLKGCHVFMEHVTTKKAEDKSEEKRLKDVPIVRDFPEVFPEDLLARAPYRLAPSEMKELSDQLQELSDKGFIRPSSTPLGVPVLFVKKKDGSFRMCIDYREEPLSASND
ncbi:putative reverse transcriptase domain-containing protein [Tanacetum coccineum]|uniref:Reverse transcriptase domain-containing protein n=1 Tax=Tanacetum coccineum TaxID=301880 RepID=A0ABQ4XE40_9ASTR